MVMILLREKRNKGFDFHFDFNPWKLKEIYMIQMNVFLPIRFYQAKTYTPDLFHRRVITLALLRNFHLLHME